MTEELDANHLDLSHAKTLFEIQGFLKINSLFPLPLIDALADSLSRQMKDEYHLKNGARIHNNRFILPLALQGPFNDPLLYANPRLLSLMRTLLGPSCILGSLGAVVAFPGATDQHIHADYEPLFKEEPLLRGALPPYAITVAVPLVDIDVINGPTKIWPGSHRMPHADRSHANAFPKHLLMGRKGSCYFWDYRTLHAGGSNFSEDPRPLLYMAFTRRWFKDTLNPDELIVDMKELPQEHWDLFSISLKKRNKQAEEAFSSDMQALLKPFITPG